MDLNLLSELTALPAVPKPSGRKGSRKVRTGCITCKSVGQPSPYMPLLTFTRIRKVKCDEAKPHCQRCVKTGRKCDGYKPPPAPSPQNQSLSPVPAGFESPDESRAFSYYQNRSAGILAGTVDVGFWNSLVLKLSTTEPAVRHAMLALSSMHECVETKVKNGRDRDRTFAFREYGKAIGALQKWSPGTEPSALPLLVCILFICFEFLADREAASQMHICQGRKILSGLQDSRSPTMQMVKESLVPIYTRLSLASFLFGSRPARIPEFLRIWTSMPAIFTSIDEARCLLYQILDDGLQFSAGAGVAVFSADPGDAIQKMQIEQERLLSQLRRWDAAFTVLVSMSPQSPASTISQNLLRIYYHACFIWISTALERGQMAYDSYLPAFSSMISLASSIISSPSYQASKAAAFSFETEVVAPVYWAATKCRHPMLRRAAIRLLNRDRVKNRRENLWHTKEIAVVATRLVEMEEVEFEITDDWDLNPEDPLAGLEHFMKLDGRRPGFVRRQTLSPEDLNYSLEEPCVGSPAPPLFLSHLPDMLSANTPSESGSSGEVPSEVSSEPTSIASMSVESAPPLTIDSLGEKNLESSFGIEEYRRVKNAAIGPREEGGVWATFFRGPEPGSTEWKITREFLTVC